jgi:hypothetical protein
MLEALANLTYGTAVNRIGTFDGWTLWLGWDGTFSENYDPYSETYAWVVYFAPEGMYVALQQAQSNYSNVDMYAGYDYFYGVLESPRGSVLTKAYIQSLLGVTLSIDAFDTSFATAGALSHVSLAISSAQTVFRIGSLKSIQRGIQYSAGPVASFSLMPFSLPFGVSLDYESSVAAGFYPIVLWDIEAEEGTNPADLIIDELNSLAQEPGDSFPGCYNSAIADMLIPFMESLPSSDSLREFMESDTKTSQIDTALNSVEQWLRTGDTAKLPGGITVPPPSEQYETMRPVRTITDMCFELAYEHAAKVRGDSTLYADCIETVSCTPGDNCTVTVTAQEISDLIPGSAPEDFEDVWIGFDTIPEALLDETDDVMWTWISDGSASYTFVNNTDTPIFMGVQVYPDAVTGDKTIELCRRKIVFDETFTVTEVDSDEIEYDNATGSGCIAASVLTGPSAQADLELLRAFRDRILEHSSCGKDIIRAYYGIGDDVIALLNDNPDLHSRCAALFREAAPQIRSLINNKPAKEPHPLREKAHDFLADLARRASPELRSALLRIMHSLQHKDIPAILQ